MNNEWTVSIMGGGLPARVCDEMLSESPFYMY